MSKCETEFVDAAKAKELRETANFSLQRPMSESNILRLEAEMRAGRFVPGTPIYFGVLPDKSILALNGNHTLEAIGRCDTAIELTFIYQDVKDQTEAAALYSRLDLQKRRSWQDSMRAFGKEEFAGSRKWRNAFSTSLGFLFEKFRAARNDKERMLARIQGLQSRDLRLKAMEEAEIPANHYVEAVSNAVDPKIFTRASVMGVGIEILRHQQPKGFEFFRGLAQDDGLRKGDARWALLRYLREHKAYGAPGREALARAVALAWNAYLADRELTIIKPGAMGEFRIDGTPWVDPKFDPLREYLPEVFLIPTQEAAEAEPTFLAPEPEPAKADRRRRIRGVDAKTMRPVTIFDEDRLPVADTEKEKVPETADAEG